MIALIAQPMELTGTWVFDREVSEMSRPPWPTGPDQCAVVAADGLWVERKVVRVTGTDTFRVLREFVGLVVTTTLEGVRELR